MQFTFNAQDYRIRFGYASMENGENGKRGLVWGGKALTNVHDKYIRTYCTISKKGDRIGFMGLTEEPIHDWIPIAGDFCVRSPEDPFIKEVGRRAALTRALWQIKDKLFHYAVWECYLNRDKSILKSESKSEKNETKEYQQIVKTVKRNLDWKKKLAMGFWDKASKVKGFFE